MAISGDAILLLRGISFSDPLVGFRSFAPGPLFIDVLVFAPAVFMGITTLDVVGLFLNVVLAFPLLVTMVLLKIWERHGGSGAIGDMGFAFLIAGTSWRVYLELLGA
jgi:hypothetical protein